VPRVLSRAITSVKRASVASTELIVNAGVAPYLRIITFYHRRKPGDTHKLPSIRICGFRLHLDHDLSGLVDEIRRIGKLKAKRA